MSERRLIDREDLPTAKSLLDSMKADAPAEGAEARVLAALGLAGATTTIAAAGAASKGASAASKAIASAKWLLFASTVAAIAAVVFLARPTRHDPPEVATHAPTVAPASSAAVSTSVDPTSTIVVPPHSPGPSAAPSIAPRKPMNMPATKAAAKPAAPTLKHAIALVDAARTALALGKPDEVLAAVDRHDATFPASPLRPEADVLRAEALFMRGDRQASAAIARDIVERMPGTANARRAQKILDAVIR